MVLDIPELSQVEEFDIVDSCCLSMTLVFESSLGHLLNKYIKLSMSLKKSHKYLS